MSYDNWQSDPYAQKWLGKLTGRTKENCIHEFPKFLEWVQKSPTELIKMKVQDMQTKDPTQKGRVEDKVIQFKQFLETQGYKRSTIRTNLNRVMSFFSHNRVKLSFARGDLKVHIAESEKVVQEWILDNIEIRALYSIAGIRDKVCLLLLYHSGLSPTDVAQLKIEQLKGIHKTEDHYYIEVHRQKTGIPQKTCLSSELLHDIKLMLRERGNPEKGPLLLTHKNEPMTTRSIRDAMKNLCEKVYPERLSDFECKNFRDSYNDSLLRSEIKQEIKDVLMGHKRQSARGHYHVSPTTIKLAYEKVFKHLSINHGTQSRQDLARMEDTVTGLSQIITKQQREIAELKRTFEPKNLRRLFEKVLDDYMKSKQ